MDRVLTARARSAAGSSSSRERSDGPSTVLLGTNRDVSSQGLEGESWLHSRGDPEEPLLEPGQEARLGPNRTLLQSNSQDSTI